MLHRRLFRLSQGVVFLLGLVIFLSVAQPVFADQIVDITGDSTAGICEQKDYSIVFMNASSNTMENLVFSGSMGTGGVHPYMVVK